MILLERERVTGYNARGEARTGTAAAVAGCSTPQKIMADHVRLSIIIIDDHHII
jgi:hypothetical protein